MNGQTLKTMAGWTAALLLALGLQAQGPAARPAKVPVLVLGTYHFANPNLDYVKTDVDDHLSEKRQKEIQDVVDRLAKFKPTKIALEHPEGDDRLQRQYEAYLKSEHTLRVNESEQIGFRLAKQLGHTKVYAVDHKLDMDFEAVIAAAQQSGDRKFLETFQSAMVMIQDMQKRQAIQTVRENLAEMNDPKHIDLGRDLYLQLARVRTGDKYVGADVLSDWYQRNFRIFANLVRVIDSPEDRVLVMFGSSHSANLRELVQSSPDLEVVEAGEYLGGR
jgi:Family of unknown function (DUF5694)